MTEPVNDPTLCPMCQIAEQPGTPAEKAVKFRSEIISAVAGTMNETEQDQAVRLAKKIDRFVRKDRNVSRCVAMIAFAALIDEMSEQSLEAHTGPATKPN